MASEKDGPAQDAADEASSEELSPEEEALLKALGQMTSEIEQEESLPEGEGTEAPLAASPGDEEVSDEGLTDDERQMLEALSGEPPASEANTETEGAVGTATETPADAEGAEGTPADAPDEGLSPEERAMLAALSGESPAEEGPAQAESSPAELPDVERPTAAAEPPATPTVEPAASAEAPDVADEQVPAKVEEAAPADASDLSAEELEVLASAKQETARVAQEEVPRMFEEGTSEPAGEPTVAQVIAEVGGETPAVDDARPAGLQRVLAWPFDVINYPFRWMPPVVRMGLGLCAVLLLLTLFLVKLFQLLLGS